MTLTATVLIPTHDHGRLLGHSVGSALRQTVEDLEVLIVGDGASDETREEALRLEKDDDRVRFFDNPKGPNRGEILRHAALTEARGRIVCYLCDDDLWLPDHVETLDALLGDADFGHTLPFYIETDGTLRLWPGNLAQPWFRERLFRGINFIPLSAGAHTMDLYRRSEGWQTSPPGAYTDLTMWQRLLRVPGCRAVSGTTPTLLHCPTSTRPDWSLERRLEEVRRWEADARTPGFREKLLGQLVDELVRERARYEEGMEGRVGVLSADAARAADEAARAEAEREVAGERLASVERELDAIRRTKTWRARERLLRMPFLGALARPAAGRRASRHPGQ